MAARIYSERFLKGRASSGSQLVTVPAGKRAVVRFISVNVYDAGLEYLVFDVGGVTVVYLYDVPAFTIRHYDLRAVAYAGEEIKVTLGGADLSWSVQGFLFADS